MTKSPPSCSTIIGKPDGVRRSPCGKSKTVPGGEKVDGRKKVSCSKAKTSLSTQAKTKVRNPVGDEETAGGKRKKPVGDKEPAKEKEPSAKRRPNVVRRTKDTGRNTPPVEETEHDVLLTPVRKECNDVNVDKGENDNSNDHSDGNNDDHEEVDDDEDDDDEGAGEDNEEDAGDHDDESEEVNDDKDEEYGNDDKNVEEASEVQDAAWDDDEDRTADHRENTALFSQKVQRVRRGNEK